MFMEIHVMSGWEHFPLPSVVKPKPKNEVLSEATVMNMS